MCDASALVALLLDSGSDGTWALAQLTGADLAAPAHLPFEAGNIIRRYESAQLTHRGQAAQAHADLLALDIALWPYELIASRAWELRRNLTIYDAAYVAVAEITGAPLVTLDRRIKRAPKLRCDVVHP